MIYGCRVTGVGVGRFLGAAIIPAAVAASPAVALLAIITAWRTPLGWPTFILYSTGYTVAYALGCVVFLQPALGGGAFTDLKTALFGATS